MDDARRRDNGERVDTVGGWHDAGDLRKWVDATLMDLFGLLSILRNLSTFPSSGALSKPALLAEVKYGNAYFLKMQDADGLVWADVAGGINGDNSDNHWTDNVAGTADDRRADDAGRLLPMVWRLCGPVHADVRVAVPRRTDEY